MRTPSLNKVNNNSGLGNGKSFQSGFPTSLSPTVHFLNQPEQSFYKYEAYVIPLQGLLFAKSIQCLSSPKGTHWIFSWCTLLFFFSLYQPNCPCICASNMASSNPSVPLNLLFRLSKMMFLPILMCPDPSYCSDAISKFVPMEVLPIHPLKIDHPAHYLKQFAYCS